MKIQLGAYFTALLLISAITMPITNYEELTRHLCKESVFNVLFKKFLFFAHSALLLFSFANFTVTAVL
ncbi:hypothetical protein SK128_007381, partial [Halocaridina rubra]